MSPRKILLALFLTPFGIACEAQPRPAMYYSDSSRLGTPMAKDPKVIRFGERYLMYYSIPPGKNNPKQGWGIGIAESRDLVHWQRAGEIAPAASYEEKGICAPGAIVKDGILHLFYQTYGNGPKDAICHATSSDGIHFDRDVTNPVFRPTGEWTCGRAIDAEVVAYRDRYYLYFASRDSSYTYQAQGVATTSLTSNFQRQEWTQLSVDSAIIFPRLAWEKNCVEGASCIVINDTLYMFYAGGYNNEPQQIGIARSTDGLHWERLSQDPFLANGLPGTWNASESGHPDIFRDKDGSLHLFYQGNNDKGKSWFLSKQSVQFAHGRWIKM